MPSSRLVFAQLMAHLPLHTFRRLVSKYDGNRYAKRLGCLDQFLAMAYAQLTARESLREIEVCLRAQQSKLYHAGIRAPIARSTLADANESRDWRIYAEFAHALIGTARRLYADEPLGIELEQTVYALDSTTIDLCLSAFPWAPAMHAGKGGIKLHTLLDIRGAIPCVIHVDAARRHDINMLDRLPVEPGAIYLMDRGYLDFKRLYRIHTAGAFFIMRSKRHLNLKRLRSMPVTDRAQIICDQLVAARGEEASERYFEPLRRLRLRDMDSGGVIALLTNQLTLPSTAIGSLYRQRWQIEIFFRWIKQHLRIRSFLGRSANAVKTQVWIAVATYVLIAIIRKRMGVQISLRTMLQALSAAVFEEIPLETLFSLQNAHIGKAGPANQLNLFGD